LIAEALEILVVWLAISLKQGMLTATAGVGIGVLIILATALFLGRTGIFRMVPAVVLDAFVAFLVTGYGVYFLREALNTDQDTKLLTNKSVRRDFLLWERVALPFVARFDWPRRQIRRVRRKSLGSHSCE